MRDPNSRAFQKPPCACKPAGLGVGSPQVKSQEPLGMLADSERIGHFLDSDHSPDLLHCSILPQKPVFDFAFRFNVGYIAVSVRCRGIRRSRE